MRLCILLLLAAPLLAEPRSVARIRLEGAELLLQMVTVDAIAVGKLHENGAASLADVQAAERRRLDAVLDWLDAAHAAGEEVPDAAKRRRDTLEKIEQLEARRYAAAQKLAAAGKLDAESLLERRVAHQLSWIERNHADQVANAKGETPKLRAERERQRAKVELLAAKERLERRTKLQEAGQATAMSVRAAERAVVRAETALAIAKERLRLAEQ